MRVPVWQLEGSVSGSWSRSVSRLGLGLDSFLASIINARYAELWIIDTCPFETRAGVGN